MFGYTEEEMLQTNAALLHVNSETYLEFANLAFDSVLHGKPVGIDYQFKKKDGTLFWVHIAGDIVKGQEEVLWTLVDITKTFKANEEKEKINERLQLALLGNNDGIWDWNLLTNEVYYSPRWKEMLGYYDDELPNIYASWKKRANPEDIPKAMDAIRKCIAGEIEYLDNIHRIRHKDGHWVWIHSRARTVLDKDSNAIRITGTHTDITEQQTLQLKLAQQQQVIEQIHDSVISTDLDGNIIGWNHASEIILGYSAKEMLGKHVTHIYLEEDYEDLGKNIAQLMQNGFNDAEVRLVKKSGEIINAELSLSLLKDEDGNPTGMIGYSKDVTKRKQTQDILHHQAYHDALTGLPNRALFQNRLKESLKKAKKENSTLALFFIDLDHFKEINDSFGHKVGDEILKIITDIFKKVIRKEDNVARLGGDEFTILLENLNRPQDASRLAKKILEELEKPLLLEDNEFYVSSSIGISIYPHDGDTCEDLLKYADSAMYRAKDEGRNNFQYYSPEMTELAYERVIMETNLRDSLKNQDFVVYYQPQVDGRTDKIIGMEALVRWNHPSLGLLPPDKFIPLAESTGLIVELDRFVMRSAMTQLATWYKQGLNPGRLAMNLAVKQLQQQDFISAFTTIMQETGCKAEWLELEVTESQIMRNPKKAIKILQQISDIGIELAVDDFGTGYSSLAYLKKFPIDKLKIDQSFVKDLPDDKEDAAITKAVIALANSLQLRIIAEGVEKREQKDFIVESGCHNIQGYFYSKPIPAEDMELLLKKSTL